MVGQWIVTNAAADLLQPAASVAALFGSAGLYAILFARCCRYFFRVADDGATSVAAAGLITAVAFAGLTIVAVVTRKDLSFLRPIVMYGFVAALALIVGAIIFGLSLGVWFSVGMVALTGAAILYQTQTIIREFPVAAHVAGALALFSSVMTLFWYIFSSSASPATDPGNVTPMSTGALLAIDLVAVLLLWPSGCTSPLPAARHGRGAAGVSTGVMAVATALAQRRGQRRCRARPLRRVARSSGSAPRSSPSPRWSSLRCDRHGVLGHSHRAGSWYTPALMTALLVALFIGDHPALFAVSSSTG